jgi:hypothetical protein
MYDPQLGRFHTLDAFAEKYYQITPYAYALNDPIKFIDIDGNDVILSFLTDQAHIVALQNMMSTQTGRNFIGRYMSKDQTLTVGNKTYTFNSTGDRAKDNLYIESTSESRMGDRNGLNRTFTKDFNKELSEVGLNDNITKGVNQVIDLKEGLSEKKATMTLGHEAFVHADRDADKLNEIDKKIENGSYSDPKDYINDITDVGSSVSEDHKALGEGKVKKYESYSNELSIQKKDEYYKEEYKKQVKRY